MRIRYQKQYDAIYNQLNLETAPLHDLIDTPERDMNKLVEYINLGTTSQIHKSFSFCDLCSAPTCGGCDIYEIYPRTHKRPQGLRRLGLSFVLPLYDPYGFTEKQLAVLKDYLLKTSVTVAPIPWVGPWGRVEMRGAFHTCEIRRAPASIWSKIREYILERDCHTCVICQGGGLDHRGRLEIHHIDGCVINNTPHNLVTLCSTHNHCSAAYSPWTRSKIAQYFERGRVS